MTEPTAAEVLQAYEGWRSFGVDLARPCPTPGCEGTLRIKQLENGAQEWGCTKCRRAALLETVRETLQQGRRGQQRVTVKRKQGIGVNGAASPEPAHSIVSVVSVVQEKDSQKPPEGPPETLPPECFYGLIGEIVRAIEPETEAHPAAILGALIANLGVLVGPGPHLFRDGGRHGVNEFVSLVGPSGSGRKGSAGRRVEEVIENLCDPYTTSQHDINDDMDMRESEQADEVVKIQGLSSGEGLIGELARAVESGESWPRRLVIDEELARALKCIERQGSILSEVLRPAWDGAPLAVTVKSGSISCKRHHVGVLTHTTEEELRKRLGTVEQFNGFCNRFLWFWIRRVRFLPRGGKSTPAARQLSILRGFLPRARRLMLRDFDDEAGRIWDLPEIGLYRMLSDRPPGLFGSVTARADTHVTRLALLYSLWDDAETIGVPHLLAALGVWEYAERSCLYLFGGSSGDEWADKLDEILLERYPGYLSVTEQRDLFNRNAPAGALTRARRLLEQNGKARRIQLPHEGQGRPVEAWVAVPLEERFLAHDKNDRNDLNPSRYLRQARDLLG